MQPETSETNEIRSFGPYDSDIHNAEKAEENIVPASREEISSSVETQTPEQRNTTREEAVRKVAEIPNKNEAVYSMVKDAAEKNKSVEDVINMLTGYSARILSESLPPEKCRIVYKSAQIGAFPSTDMSATEYFELKYGIPTRKDLALLADFFDMEAPKLNPETEGRGILTHEQIQQTKKDVLHVLSNYKQILDEWKNENNATKFGVQREQLIRWYIEHEQHKPEGPAGKIQNMVIDEAFRYISYSDKEIEKSLLTNFHDPVSLETIIPTSFLLDEKDSVVGAVVMTAYSKYEMKALIDVLERVYNLTGREEDTLDFHDKVTRLDSYDLRGLQVNIPKDYEDGRVAGMRLGPNITGVRNLIQIVNHPETERFRYDTINPKTAEVTSIRDPLVIYRLPDDIPDEDVEKLGSLATKLGYGNLIIQKVPFSRDDVKQLAFALFKNTFPLESTEETCELRKRNGQMFSELGDPATWELKRNKQ